MKSASSISEERLPLGVRGGAGASPSSEGSMSWPCSFSSSSEGVERRASAMRRAGTSPSSSDCSSSGWKGSSSPEGGETRPSNGARPRSRSSVRLRRLECLRRAAQARELRGARTTRVGVRRAHFFHLLGSRKNVLSYTRPTRSAAAGQHTAPSLKRRPSQPRALNSTRSRSVGVGGISPLSHRRLASLLYIAYFCVHSFAVELYFAMSVL